MNLSNQKQPIFKIVTSAITPDNTGDSPRLRGIASGTALDAEGDRISEKALRSMEKQIRGLTLHKDHVFKVDNTLGHFVNAKITASPNGDIHELWVEAELEPFDINPDAKRVFDKIKSGTPLGFSIAGILKDFERLDSKGDKPRFLITDIELLSVDLVSIPAYRASQGSISAFSDKSVPDNAHDIYICKQIGEILRQSETNDTDNDTVDDQEHIESRLEHLERKIHDLEEMLVNIRDEHKTKSLDSSSILARLAKIEARVVNPPKSNGLMVGLDGVARDVSSDQTDSDDIAAFESGAGNLLGKL